MPQKNVSGIASSANNIIIGAASIKQTKVKKKVPTANRFFILSFSPDLVSPLSLLQLNFAAVPFPSPSPQPNNFPKTTLKIELAAM